MQVSKDEIIEQYAKNCGQCNRKTLYHTNMVGLVFLVDIML